MKRTLRTHPLLAGFALLFFASCSLPRWNTKVDVNHRARTDQHGITIQEILTGIGPEVTPSSEVTLDYKVSLESGDPVDSSYDRGLPITFRMGEAPILGWEYALLGMKPGGRRLATLPPYQAYGEQGVEGLIPPLSVLVCEFELLEVADQRQP
ncbi:MAG: FKBP-type peptidyl-prolyl cis-trans isomerase [Planctomycetota bacterium]|nr:FKBP-type peptidyl-prolyl cis-trans isomerase [Planctomycetota bacterium]